jgi:CofH/MqnC C-terminal region
METVRGLDAIAERVSRGDVLSLEDGRAILATNDLIEIGVLADSVRRQRHGARTTFVRVFETHVDAPASALPPQVSAGEIRIVGAPRDAASAIAAVQTTAAIAGSVPLTGFSLADLIGISQSHSALASLCSGLHEAGLRAIAEVPIDSLADAAAAVQAARGGGLAVLRLTVNSLENEDGLGIVQRARTLGGFRAFAPLPRTLSVALPTTGYDDVKLIALARLLCDNIDSIQVDWPLYGPKLAQVALTVGADDVDGVAAVDPGTLGTRRSAIEEITRNIRAAALEPSERDALFAGVRS